MKPRKHHSLSTKFGLLLIASGIISVLFFFLANSISQSVINARYSDEDYIDQLTTERVKDFQKYVTDNRFSSSDKDAISQWVKNEPLSVMEIYRSNVLIFSSYAPESYDITGNTAEAPYYEWLDYHEIEFSDGKVQVLMEYNFALRYSVFATVIEVVLSSLLFLTLFLLGCRKTVQYIRQICRDIQGMEGGDLDTPVTIKGNDDLTTLSESLEAMRVAFSEQQEQSARAYAANQQLISEMSHDIRTPLTTLMIYTEILRYHKYESDEQLREYLIKIDAKAQQIKQLSQKLLEYSLMTKEAKVQLEEPAPIQCIFEESLYEMVSCISQYGYRCNVDWNFPPAGIAVYMPFIRRITDNITSNILKYADVSSDIRIWAFEEPDCIGICFENKKSSETNVSTSESSHIGLTVVRSLMEKMNGKAVVEQPYNRFLIILRFPKQE